MSCIAHTYFFQVSPLTVSFGFQGNCTHSYLGDDGRGGAGRGPIEGSFNSVGNICYN